MGNTIRRKPITTDVPSNPDYKFLNVTDFRGLNMTDNPFTVKNNTASDCLNVYVDEFNSLSTRPRLELKYELSNTYSNIVGVYNLNDGYLVQYKMSDTSDKCRLVRMKISDTNDLIAIPIIDNWLVPNTKLFVFQHDDQIYMLTGKSYLVIYANIVRNVLDIGYIPERYSVEGATIKNIEPLNILSNRYYSTTSVTGTPAEILADNTLTDKTILNLTPSGKGVLNDKLLWNQANSSLDYPTISSTTPNGNNQYSVVVTNNTDATISMGDCNYIQTDVRGLGMFSKSSNGWEFINVISQPYGFKSDRIALELPVGYRADDVYYKAVRSKIYTESNPSSFYFYEETNPTSVLYTIPLDQYDMFVVITSYDKNTNTPIRSDAYVQNCPPRSTGSSFLEWSTTIDPKDYVGFMGNDRYATSSQLVYVIHFEPFPPQVAVQPMMCKAVYDDVVIATDKIWCYDDGLFFSPMDLVDGYDVTYISNTGGSYYIVTDKTKDNEWSFYKLYGDNFSQIVDIGIKLADVYDGYSNTSRVPIYGPQIFPDDLLSTTSRLLYNADNVVVNVENIQSPAGKYVAYNSSSEGYLSIGETLVETDGDYEMWMTKRNEFLKSLLSIRFDNDQWFASGNTVFHTSYNDPTCILLKNYSELGDPNKSITGFNLGGDELLIAYKNDNLYAIRPQTLTTDEDADGTEEILYTYTKTETKNSVGNDAFGATIVTTLTETPLQITHDGIFALNQLKNVQSSDRVSVLISEGISKKWLKESFEAIDNAKTLNRLYWTYIILNDEENDKSKVYLLDNRTNSWFYWELPIVVLNAYNKDNVTNVVDTYGNVYILTKEDIPNKYNLSETEYYDDEHGIISWFWTSQVLPLGTINYRKRLLTTTFIVSDNDMTVDLDGNTIIGDQYGLNYQYKTFRKKASLISELTISGDVEYVRSVVKRTVIPKVDYVQLKISNIENDKNNNKLRLSGLALKYTLVE